ncbi:hypothetical protein [Acetobacter thailandicus]|uniref:Uncharacterized protein n=1 Tax=Acetobacter thailandicus TaxID=1502842 RepID=A0ABT3QHF0_9PROT|nr:hypothetical protein [Acetobacter thailandicus]MCX2564707.1 hypothetical protein [Acetobacter thailandicus]NHN96261.1 hypothetical protein [Acetobacter thailandicus]
MSFIVNGADWDFNNILPKEVAALIEKALAFIATSSERDEEVAVGDDFQTRPMCGTLTLWDLFSPNGPLWPHRELSEELVAWLSKAPRYADAYSWPIGFEGNAVSVAGSPAQLNTEIEWVHFAVLEKKPVACFTLGDAKIVSTTTLTESTLVHFVSDEMSRKTFWRDAIVLVGDDLKDLQFYASHAYPNLYFVDNVINNAAKLVGGYNALRDRVKNALAVLDDWGEWIFKHPPPAIKPSERQQSDPDTLPNKQIIQRRLTAMKLEAAPENPNVRCKRVSREARETVLSGKVLYCEWHIKLEPHQNRIHFHAPVSVSDNKVVIGMIDKHLPLP